MEALWGESNGRTHRTSKPLIDQGGKLDSRIKAEVRQPRHGSTLESTDDSIREEKRGGEGGGGGGEGEGERALMVGFKGLLFPGYLDLWCNKGYPTWRDDIFVYRCCLAKRTLTGKNLVS